MSKAKNKPGILMKLGGSLLASYIRLVYRTSEVVYDPPDMHTRLLRHDPLILAMWHGQFLMLPMLKPPHVSVRVMVARHSDAELIGQALLQFRAELVRGAGAGSRKKDRGGATALRQSLKSLGEDRISVALTADVPPGPARKAGDGIITMARLSGRPVIPAAVASSRYLSLNTWSRFTINLPFSRLAFVSGDPIYVAEDATPEECEKARLALEQAMNRVTEKAYRTAGADPLRATPVSALPDDIQLPKGLALKTYEILSGLARPLVPWFLAKRIKRGKEDPARQYERLGQASLPRPEGKLLWFHAASVGETNAILPLMHILRKRRPDLMQMLTTGTVTSANLASQRMPEGAIHQYVPVDAPQCVSAFLRHWKPDLAFFTESEVWPNLVVKTRDNNIPLILLNGTISARSFKRWKGRQTMARALFSRFKVILAQNGAMKKRFEKLGARDTRITGNLKMDAPLLPVNETELFRLKKVINGRTIFLAASTHDGEDEVVARAHNILKSDIPGLLTIIAPRHPERGEAIAGSLGAMGLNVARRGLNQTISDKTDIYIADTIGELGIFYSLAPVAFMGGSVIPHGGQNPIEAIKLGTGVLTGPHWHNFNDSYRELFKLNGAREILTAETLARAARDLLLEPEQLEKMNANAQEAVRNLSGALGRTIEAIMPYLPPEPEGADHSSRLRRVS